MAYKKLMLLAAVAVLTVTATFLLRPQKTLAPPVRVSHYRFILRNVSETCEWSRYVQTSPYHQVCVTLQIQQADQYHDSTGTRPMLNGNHLIPRAQLVTKDGTRLHLLDAKDISEDPLHFTVVHHIYDRFKPEADVENYYMVYVFENPEQYKIADFEADVQIPAYDINNIRTPDPPPFVRPLRFNNLALP